MIESIKIHHREITASVVLTLAVLIGLDAKAKADGISAYDELIEISSTTVTLPARLPRASGNYPTGSIPLARNATAVSRRWQ